MDFKTVSLAENPEIIETMKKMVYENFPKFISMTLPYLNEVEEKANGYFADFAFILTDDTNTVAFGQSMPLFWDDHLSNLPEEGWEWALKTATKGYDQNIKPNILCATTIVVDKAYRGMGVSKLVLQELLSIAERKGFDKVIVPVWPSGKSNYPMVDISQYMSWRREDGYLYDSWLRVHEKLGAQIVKPCRLSMYLEGSVQNWEQLTGMSFSETGEYEAPSIQADTLLKIDIERDIGILKIPNVWVVHQLKK